MLRLAGRYARRCAPRRRALHWSSLLSRCSPDASATRAPDFSVDLLPALEVLAESLAMLSKNPAFQSWTSADWLLGLTVMAQHNTTRRRRQPPARPHKGEAAADEPLAPLLRYVRLSDAVYAPTAAAFCREAHLPPESVVRSARGGVFSPKFALVLDHAAREIVLVVRGSATILDFCTDLCLVNDPLHDGQGHRGIVRASQWLVHAVEPDLKRLTRAYPAYAVTTTGHSLGAGVAALAALEWRRRGTFPTLRCVAFATPACVTRGLAQQCREFVTTVVHGDDCVPRLHQHSLQLLHRDVSAFDWRAALKAMVDEEIEEQKALVKRERDELLQEIQQAFEQLQQAALRDVADSEVGKRVSASIEVTEAAFAGPDEPVHERFARVKRVLRHHKHAILGAKDDARAQRERRWWDAVESGVDELERLAAKTPTEELLAVVATAEEQEKVSGLCDRLSSAVDQAAERLRLKVKEAITDVTETVTTKVQSEVSKVEQDVQELQDQVQAALDDSLKAWQDELRSNTEAVRALLQREEWRSSGAAGQSDLATVFDGWGDDCDDEEGGDALAALPDDAADVPEDELHDELFPPGRILSVASCCPTT
ncbi:hypothetical protein P43SY_005294 [Pythium insidiosum]|uniref:Fungal lipase-type domain-containing protein n=1 Tax=Pythium insidiosum TaxID=114742 RepID=A0AAD5Q4T2_PYTIN|nr:hypothetical protein P43SY_005294 [Pythium insidiosum]